MVLNGVIGKLEIHALLEVPRIDLRVAFHFDQSRTVRLNSRAVSHFSYQSISTRKFHFIAKETVVKITLQCIEIESKFSTLVLIIYFSLIAVQKRL